jgi:DNA primase
MRTDNGLFVCYSAGCGASGNLITFLMTGLGWSFNKALKASEREGIVSLDDPATYSLPEYLKRRSEVEIEATVTEGWLGAYDFCPKYMLRRGFERRTLREWGIGYDYGTGRVTIPVRDSSGKLVGISKRSTRDDGLPKYLHLGFQRGRFLYGMEKCPRGSTVVLTEGQFDVLSWWQSFQEIAPDVIPLSTMGSKVTVRQITWIARNCKRVILAFDNDSDGQATVIRVGDALQKRMNPGRVFGVTKWPEGYKDVGDMVKLEHRRARKKLWDSLEYYSELRHDWMLYQHKGDLRERKTRHGKNQGSSRREQVVGLH